MRLVDVGSGPPLVVVPGIQGRWEWHKPGIDALARHYRVITFSLADERSAHARWDDRAGFANYVNQVDEAMDQAGLASAAVCGISYGGLVAAAFAAAHPSRVDALVLASAIPPSWRPDARVRRYLRAPRLLSPVFCVASLRLYPEFLAAYGTAFAGARGGAGHLWRAATHIFSPVRMARRVTILEQADLGPRIASARVPTLIITGDDGLDRVVPASLTREYLALWPHAEAATVARTGHLGFVTRPDEFARVVGDFVAAHPRGARSTQDRRRVG